jgi:hypothetical protein
MPATAKLEKTVRYTRKLNPPEASVRLALALPAAHRPKTSPCRPNRPPGKNRGEVEGVDAGGPRTGRAGRIGCGGLQAMHACARSSPSATPSRTSASALSSSIPCSRSPPNAVAEPRTSVRRVARPAGLRLRCREREREREIQIESRSGREEGQWCWRVAGMGMGA